MISGDCHNRRQWAASSALAISTVTANGIDFVGVKKVFYLAA
tara:strand:- start:73 stop:198 length:126 start_codon:yes stop_codon:yes gene_type:complete